MNYIASLCATCEVTQGLSGGKSYAGHSLGELNKALQGHLSTIVWKPLRFKSEATELLKILEGY